MQDTFTSQPYKRIEFYRERYTNCTIVTSNLEIAHLYPQPGSDYDLSFFENIREVHGYVLVASSLVNRVPLTSLRVIRGLVLYEFTSSGSGTEEQEDDIYLSLYVGGNINRAPNGSLQGVRILELPALRGKCILLDIKRKLSVSPASYSPDQQSTCIRLCLFARLFGDVRKIRDRKSVV